MSLVGYLPYDLQSLLPRSQSAEQHIADVPHMGAKAPRLDTPDGRGVVDYTQANHLVAFVRHCGCPFAEKELRSLAAAQRRRPNDVRIVVVSHSKHDVVQDWFKRIGKPHFTDLSRVTVLADPDFKIYHAFGIGQLGWSGLLSLDMLRNVRALATQEGIKNTRTGEGSNRWLNSGGFAIDTTGTVCWGKVAKDASDVCDYKEALQTLPSES